MSPLSYSDISPGRLGGCWGSRAALLRPPARQDVDRKFRACSTARFLPRASNFVVEFGIVHIRALQACNPTAGKSQSRSKSCPRQKTHRSEREARA
jgi:hypothetical protein